MTWDTNNIIELATGYWKSATLSTAVELGLFEALDNTSSTAVNLAENLGLSKENTELLLDALTALNLLQKKDDLYCIEPSALDFLTPSGSRCLLSALHFNIDMYPLWGQMATSIREGRPVLPPNTHLGNSPERTRRFVLGMHSKAKATVSKVLPALDLKNSKSLLDVGSGPGTLSYFLAEQYPDLQVTLYDLPPVLEIAEGIWEKHLSRSRITFHPGNYRNDPLPSHFDTAIFTGALHQEPWKEAACVMDKIYKSLNDGGRVFVVDFMLCSNRTQPLFSTLFALNMMLTKPTSRIYTEDEVFQLLLHAGFTEPQRIKLSESPNWVITARKSNTTETEAKNIDE